jgi:hypothetical protein
MNLAGGQAFDGPKLLQSLSQQNAKNDGILVIASGSAES